VKLVDIDLGAIKKLTLSPWIPDAVAESVQSLIKTINGCERLSVNRSSLINNSDWRKAIE
jgi:hypothetical protein